ncbi:PorV/PorQ family protein [bacterium]
MIILLIKKHIMLTFLLVLLCETFLFSSDAGKYCCAFLKINTNAQREAMGNSNIALTGDVFSLVDNPAGLAKIEKFEAGFTYNQWFEDISHSFAGAAHSGKFGTLGLGAIYLSIDEFDSYDASDVRQGTVGANDTAIILGYAKGIGPVRLGATGKYIKEVLDDVEGTGLAVDVGVQISILSKFMIGAGIYNVGTDVKFEDEDERLPLTKKVGLAYQHRLLTRPLILTVETQNIDENYDTGVGCEYKILSLLKLRAGYVFDEELEGTGLRAGAGFSFMDVTVDYSFSDKGILDYTHMFSVKVKI